MSLRRLLAWASAPAIVAAIYLYAATFYLSGKPVRLGLIVELCLLLNVSAVCMLFQRRPLLGAVPTTLFLLSVYTLFLGALVVFREPLGWSALTELDELVRITPQPYALAIGILGASAIGVFVANLGWPRFRSRWLLLGPTVAIVLGVAAAPRLVIATLDTIRPGNEMRRDLEAARNGPLVTLLRDAAVSMDLRRRLDTTILPPDLDASLAPFPLIAPARRHDVHVIVMESLLDPLDFGALELPIDPVDPRVRRWMTESRSLALAPTFGGLSVRTEFEILCGVPAYEEFGLDFERLRGPVPCLPYVLRRSGYLTIASMPLEQEFFSCGRTYTAMGFERRYFDDAFAFDEMYAGWLANRELFARNLALLEEARADGRPLLNYVATVDGHAPFALGAQRPPVIAGEGRLMRLVNTIHYTTTAMAAYVSTLEERDPNAIVVIVGDHLPALGPDRYARAGYRRTIGTGGREPGAARATVRELELRATPLIIRKGGRPVPVGVVPHFAVPEIILDLLTEGAYCRTADCVATDDVVARPFRSHTAFTSAARFPQRLCEKTGASTSRACARATQIERARHARYIELLRMGAVRELTWNSKDLEQRLHDRPLVSGWRRRRARHPGSRSPRRLSATEKIWTPTRRVW